MTTVVLLGHGSPDPRAAAALRSLGRAVTRTRPGTFVEVAFLDHDDPGLTDLAVQVAADGATEIVVVPAFLTTAYHVRSDIPRAVAHAESAADVRISVTAPLGPDTAILDILDRRIPPTGPVVLACAGTRDPEAQEDIAGLAKEWSARRGSDVIVAYAAMAEPDVATVVDALGTAGIQPVVASYVLLPGILADRIMVGAGSAVVTAPLGDDVARLVLARVDSVS